MKTFTRIILLIFISSIIVIAQNKKTNSFKVEEPVLITCAGQSSDILMVKILAKKAALDYKINKSATFESIKDIKSLIIVSGGSTKGLGAAKIDKEEEYKRVEKVINKARENGIKIIALHVGGKSRRGALSDYFNKLVAENADHIIVVNNGNQDSFFTNIAKEKGIGIDGSEKIILIKDILKRIFNK